MHWVLNAVYALLLTALSPLIAWRMLRHGRYRRGIAQKLLGKLQHPKGSRPVVWFHAVSVGEIVQLLCDIDLRILFSNLFSHQINLNLGLRQIEKLANHGNLIINVVLLPLFSAERPLLARENATDFLATQVFLLFKKYSTSLFPSFSFKLLFGEKFLSPLVFHLLTVEG